MNRPLARAAEVLHFAAEGECVAIGFFRDNGMLGKVVQVKKEASRAGSNLPL